MLRASGNYDEVTQIANEKKRNTVTEKYEKAYDNYLNVLEKYITDTVYNRVQKRIGTKGI